MSAGPLLSRARQGNLSKQVQANDEFGKSLEVFPPTSIDWGNTERNISVNSQHIE